MNQTLIIRKEKNQKQVILIFTKYLIINQSALNIKHSN